MSAHVLAWIAGGCVVVVIWGLVIRDFWRGTWPCPHCGRSTCDRGCIERGED